MTSSSLQRAFQEHERDLISFMSARLRCAFTAQDLAQELYLKITSLDGRAEISTEISNAKAYVFRMAANLVTDHQRREQREQREQALLSEISGFLWGGRDSSSPEQQLMARQELEDLAVAVAEMTPATRKIFKLNRFEGQTQREIARDLGISQTAVEKHIRKALKRLAARRHAT